MTTVSAISFPCWAAFDQYVTTCREEIVGDQCEKLKWLLSELYSSGQLSMYRLSLIAVLSMILVF